MRKNLFMLGVMALAVLLATSAFAANRGVSFTPIGFIDDPGPFPASAVLDMTADGSMLVTTPSWAGGYCTLTDPATLEWTLVGSTYGNCKISSDGSSVMAAILGNEGFSRTAIWNGSVDDWTLVPLPDGFAPCDLSGHSFFDMGGNADFATGLTWEGCSVARAFRWDAAFNTSVNLDSMNGDSSRGNAISDDGGTIVGWTRWSYGAWRGARWDNGVWSWIDGMGNDLSRGYCANSGNACLGYWECDVDEACNPNPEFVNYKGEAADVSADGRYVVGYNYGDSPYDWDDPMYDPYLFASAYRQGPDGFTQIPPPPGASPYDSWTPFAISDDGGTIVGRYGWWIYSYPVLWTEETGTLDFQWFLVGQGLDELWYWSLTDLTAVSADGTKVAGYGGNPDWWTEGFVVDLSKVKICHAPPGNPENRRTISISWDSVADHLAHGDELATCEFIESGARSRSLERRLVRPETMRETKSPDYNPMFRSKEEMIQMRQAAGAPAIEAETQTEAKAETDLTPKERFIAREKQIRSKTPRRR